MKIIVLGASGMLGHKMFQVLRESYENTFGTIHHSVHDGVLAPISHFQDKHIIAHVDAENFPALASLLRRIEPAVIVNCIGVIKQRTEAKAARPSILLN